MQLELHAQPNPRDPQFSGLRACSQGSLSIGRRADNDWVLNDTRRLVSNLHCIIERQGAQFVVVDRSTNGLLLNGSPVDREQATPLRDGDRIEIADYRFDVRIRTTASEIPFDPPRQSGLSGDLSITSILVDIAPRGVNATGQLPGHNQNPLFDSQSVGKSRNSELTPQLGWTGHPTPAENDLLRPLVKPTAQSKLLDEAEHIPSPHSLMDLPIPHPAPQTLPLASGAPAVSKLLPDDWNVDPTPAATPPEPMNAAPTALPTPEPLFQFEPSVVKSSSVTPTRHPLPIPTSIVETPAPTVLSAETKDNEAQGLQALAEGLGVDGSLFAHADLTTVLRNTGVMLSAALIQLRAQILEVQNVAQKLGASSPGGESTTFVLSLGGARPESLLVSVANFLVEAQSNEASYIERDFEVLRRHADLLRRAAIESLHRTAKETHPDVLTQDLSWKQNMGLPMVRKAALWDKIEHSEALVALRCAQHVAAAESLLGELYAQLRDMDGMPKPDENESH